MSTPSLLPCPLCCDTKHDPRTGYAPREVIYFLEESLPAAVFIALAEGVRLREKVHVEVNCPPDGGTPSVEVVRRKTLPGKKRA
jgi:hypothetical protein